MTYIVSSGTLNPTIPYLTITSIRCCQYFSHTCCLFVLKQCVIECLNQEICMFW